LFITELMRYLKEEVSEVFLPAFPWRVFKDCKRAVVIFPLPELKFFIKAFSLKKETSWMGFSFYRQAQDKADFVVIGPVLGASALSFVIILLSEAGIKEVLAVGWAGTTKPAKRVSQIFLPTKALSFEGISRLHFSENTSWPDLELLSTLKEFLEKARASYEEGAILSTDFPFFFEDLARKTFFSLEFPEVKALDMETSALFTLSRHFGIKSCALHFIIDKLGLTSHKLFHKELDLLRKKLFSAIKKFLSL